MELFAKSGERPKSLEQLHAALKSVPPTSVEAERVFSVSGQFYKFTSGPVRVHVRYSCRLDFPGVYL